MVAAEHMEGRRLMHYSFHARLFAGHILRLRLNAQQSYTGWSSKVYEYASNFGIPSETCNAYTAVAASSCSSIEQCYTCSPFDKDICAPLSKYVSAWRAPARALLPAHQHACCGGLTVLSLRRAASHPCMQASRALHLPVAVRQLICAQCILDLAWACYFVDCWCRTDW